MTGVPVSSLHLHQHESTRRIVKFLVWLVSSIRVANLSLKITLVLFIELFDSVPVGPLCISVNIHLDYAIAHGRPNFSICAARTSVHNQEGWFIELQLLFFLDELLMISQEVGGEDDISRLVDTVNVAERGSNREHRTDRTQCLMNFVNLLWRCI